MSRYCCGQCENIVFDDVTETVSCGLGRYKHIAFSSPSCEDFSSGTLMKLKKKLSQLEVKDDE